MSGISFVLHDAEVNAALSQLKRAAENPRPALDAVGAYMVTSTQRNIERETSPDGTRFRPLSPRTAAKRVGRGRRGFEHILRVTTRLFRSIISEATDESVEWGSNVAYARIHQLGGDIAIGARAGSVNIKSVRRKGGGFRSRFVRTGTAGATRKDVQIGAHRIVIPARPYIGLSAEDVREIPQILADHLRSEAGQ